MQRKGKKEKMEARQADRYESKMEGTRSSAHGDPTRNDKTNEHFLMITGSKLLGPPWCFDRLLTAITKLLD